MTQLLSTLIAGLILLAPLLPSSAIAVTLAPVSGVLAATATHVVAPGDTLYSIAAQYGTTVDALKAANGLTSNIIWIGQTLHIGSSSQPPATGTYHTVVRGDTLYSLARRYVTTVDAIMQANHLTSTVVSGDTLYSIARRYGTTVDTIKSLNNISGNIIYIGQLLRIPQSATFPTPTPIATRTTTPATTLTPTPTGTIPSTQTPIATTTALPTTTPILTGTPTGQATVQQGVVGQDLIVGNIRWKILSATNSGQELESNSEFLDNLVTTGQFIVVGFEVENRGADPETYDHFDLVDSQNRTFSTYDDSISSYIPENEDCGFL